MPKWNPIFLFKAETIKWYACYERQWMGYVGIGTTPHQHAAFAYVVNSVGNVVVSHNVDGKELAF